MAVVFQAISVIFYQLAKLVLLWKVDSLILPLLLCCLSRTCRIHLLLRRLLPSAAGMFLYLNEKDNGVRPLRASGHLFMSRNLEMYPTDIFSTFKFPTFVIEPRNRLVLAAVCHKVGGFLAKSHLHDRMFSHLCSYWCLLWQAAPRQTF